jgi:hypothetical protein
MDVPPNPGGVANTLFALKELLSLPSPTEPLLASFLRFPQGPLPCLLSSQPTLPVI